VVGFESEEFLEGRDAEHLAVIHFRRGTPARNQFAVPGSDTGVPKGVVHRAVDGDDQIVEGEDGEAVHRESLHGTPPKAIIMGLMFFFAKRLAEA
jgi:hypothetical protein